MLRNFLFDEFIEFTEISKQEKLVYTADGFEVCSLSYEIISLEQSITNRKNVNLTFRTCKMSMLSKPVRSPHIWVFHDRRYCQIVWQIFTQGRAKKKFVKNCPQWDLKPGPLDLQANALPTELSQHSVARLNLHGLNKVMLYWF